MSMKVYSRRKAMMQDFPPVGYKWADYIENNSTAYIDTGVNIRSKVTANIKMMATSKSSGNKVIYGLYQNNTISCQVYINSSTKFVVSPNTRVVGATNGESFVLNKVYDLSISNINAVNSDLTLFLFARNNADKLNFNGMRILECEMESNGEIIRNYRPAYRISDGKYGLYDVIGKQFYISPNGVNFVGGG